MSIHRKITVHKKYKKRKTVTELFRRILAKCCAPTGPIPLLIRLSDVSVYINRSKPIRKIGVLDQGKCVM